MLGHDQSQQHLHPRMSFIRSQTSKIYLVPYDFFRARIALFKTWVQTRCFHYSLGSSSPPSSYGSPDSCSGITKRTCTNRRRVKITQVQAQNIHGLNLILGMYPPSSGCIHGNWRVLTRGAFLCTSNLLFLIQ